MEMTREIRSELEKKLPQHVLDWLTQHFNESEQLLEEIRELKYLLRQHEGGSLGFQSNFRQYPNYPPYPDIQGRRGRGGSQNYYDDNRDVERDSRRSRGGIEPMRPLNATE